MSTIAPSFSIIEDVTVKGWGLTVSFDVVNDCTPEVVELIRRNSPRMTAKLMASHVVAAVYHAELTEAIYELVRAGKIVRVNGRWEVR